jgi:hypothetical protein
LHQSITFVCCVESGPLEEPTIRLAESLRRFAGAFASEPLIAVTPRPGPPLSRQTLNTFDKLEVQYIRFNPESPYSWYSFLNKPLALAHVEQLRSSESMCWLDSDLIVMDEPNLLTLSMDEDFLACVSEFKNNGTDGRDDEHEPYWRKVSEIIGVDLDSIPYVTTPMDQKTIRAYFNGGVFVYRRDTAFGRSYLRACVDILDSRVSCRSSGIFFTEQVALGLTAFRIGLRFRELPLAYNYPIGGSVPACFLSAWALKNAQILHHHDAMWPTLWPRFMRHLEEAQPGAHDWLMTKGPLANRSPLLWRGLGKALRMWREAQRRRFCDGCRAL